MPDGDNAHIYLGTQGWSYKDWNGSFYPPDARASEYLSLYARHFSAVELDTTFYGTPLPSRVEAWQRSTPEGFQFTAKMPREITHDRHLHNSREPLDAFLRAITRLEDKLGAILIQMPPDFVAEERDLLEAFLNQLPQDLRFALELRHRSWLDEPTFDLLREHDVAWTLIDLSFMPTHLELTTNFTYVRWLGNRKQIQRMHEVQIDRRYDLEKWARTLETAASRVERIYGFVNNHYSGHSPADVRVLRQLLQLDDEPSDELTQGQLL